MLNLRNFSPEAVPTSDVVNTINNLLGQYNLLDRLSRLELWIQNKGDPKIDIDLPNTILQAKQDVQQYIDQVKSQARQDLDDYATSVKAQIDAASQQATVAANKAQVALISVQVASNKAEEAATNALNAAQQATDALGKARIALSNLASGFTTVRDRALDANNALASTISAFSGYGNIIAYRAAHSLDPLSGPGHLFCFVNDVSMMMSESIRRAGYDPNFTLPYNAIPTYFTNVQAAFANLYNALRDLVFQLPPSS